LVILGGMIIVAAAAGAEGRVWTKAFQNKKAPELVVEKWLTKVKGVEFGNGRLAIRPAQITRGRPEINENEFAFRVGFKKYGDRLVVIGLSDETEEKVRRLKEPRIDYFSAIDTQKRTATAVGVVGMPHVMLIDPDGVVRWQGFPLLEGNDITQKIVEKSLENQRTK
jgi:cytochrome c biogenesis protein CcmG, thiol:disulfide interchange protein DsbE